MIDNDDYYLAPATTCKESVYVPKPSESLRTPSHVMMIYIANQIMSAMKLPP